MHLTDPAETAGPDTSRSDRQLAGTDHLVAGVGVRRRGRSAPMVRALAGGLGLALVAAGCGSGAGAAGGGAIFGAASGAGVSASAGPVQVAGPAWAALHGPSHFGTSPVTGPQTGTIRWQRRLSGSAGPGPVVTSRNVAYAGSNGGILSAIDVSTGKDVWTFNGHGSMGGEDLSTSALVLGDGRVVWPGPNHTLFGLSATGRQQWTIPAAADLVTPVLDPQNGALIVADQHGHISGYRLPGASGGAPVRLWTRQLPSPSLSNPAVAADGTVYQDAGHSLYAITPTGRVKWSFTTPKLIEVSPAVAAGGVVVVGSDNRLEYGINPDGKLRWRVPIGNLTYSSPLAFAPHDVIFGNHSGQMTILDSLTGKRIGRDQGQGQLWTAAAVDQRDDAYFASRTGAIFGFDASGRRLFALMTPTKFDSYPALAPDGTLLIGGDNGVLYGVR